MWITHRFRVGFTLALLVVGVASSARAQDAKTRSVDAGGLVFQAPAAWKSTPPQSQMRRAQLEIEPAAGDKDKAELIVFAFPGGAGTVEANIERWQRQFRDKDGNPPKVDARKVKGRNVDVTRVEIAGHYFPANFPGQPKQDDKPSYRLLGAIVITPETGYFLRLVGPDKTVAESRAGFDAMLGTMTTGGQ